MSPSRERALNAAGLSLLYPGLGQAIQRRHLMATWLVLDFSGLALGGLLQPANQAVWWGLALALGVFAVAEAYWHDTHRKFEARAI